MNQPVFFNRDISWLYFNERVLHEAANPAVPLVERIRFLSIYSSNLTEYYRVRMPVLKALDDVHMPADGVERIPDMSVSVYENAVRIILLQQRVFHTILEEQVIPALRRHQVWLVYNTAIPACARNAVADYFFTTIAAYLSVVYFSAAQSFFPANNGLYIVAELDGEEAAGSFAIVTIPSEKIPRFFSVLVEGKRYVLFIDDIIKEHLSVLFPGRLIKGAYSIKITRDASPALDKGLAGDIARAIQKKLKKRDHGAATRFLFPPDIPFRVLQTITASFNLYDASRMQAGHYHNLRDLASIPAGNPQLLYEKQEPVHYVFRSHPGSLLKEILVHDILINPPYHSYDTVLRFFSEAAIDSEVEEIHTTMYRVANDSRIAHALISAAGNGKSVTVFVELKARFDEANNIKWSKKMKAAGVQVIYSIPGLKVHSKIAILKKRNPLKPRYIGLLATGNLNENTAKYYTDHILLTAHEAIVRELQVIFLVLHRRKLPGEEKTVQFDHLLVSQFNLLHRFVALIDREIENAKRGLPAGITIKLNHLEERALITKLYEASCAGVRVDLIVRGICCLVPQVAGLSERISVRRIVDRYLEHSRVFVFHNNGSELFFMGSADWMKRNIYRRIEVCFPVYDPAICSQIKQMLAFQLADNQSAVAINQQLRNTPVISIAEPLRAQDAVYSYLRQQINPTIKHA